MLDIFARGDYTAVVSFMREFRALGFNILRAWPYVTWPGTGWPTMPNAGVARNFLGMARDEGFDVEITLLTDDDESRIEPARILVQELSGCDNVWFEAGNEPRVHKSIDTWALNQVLRDSGRPWSTGDYADPGDDYPEAANLEGTYLVAHTPRDSEWMRKAHDLLEYFGGGGPAHPTDPALRKPIVADEPIRPDEAFDDVRAYLRQRADDQGRNPDSVTDDQVHAQNALDFMAYAAACSLLGAGATFHYEGGKWGRLPNDLEMACAKAFALGLQAFPPDAPLGGYRRIDEDGRSLRTYVVGERYMVRVRPETPDAPESGWRPLEPSGVLWTR